MEIHARHYQTGSAVSLTFLGNIIQSVNDSAQPTAELPWIAPAFFDPQINGWGGTWFSSEATTARDVLKVLSAQFRFGVARMLPTVITASESALANGLFAIRCACEMEPWADEMVAGCHLEGPWISAEDGPRGAHPKEHVRAADHDEFQRLQEAAGGRIRLVTIAPECPGAIGLIQRLVADGVRVAIGHSAASTEQVAAAVDAGAVMSTHLGNGAPRMLRRHPNLIWDQLADDRLTASVIADGHHLPLNVLRCFLRAKGPGRIVLTSDASGVAGCSPGIYDVQGTKVTVTEDGRVSLTSQPGLLAGSGVSILDCVNYVATHNLTGEDRLRSSVARAIDMAGSTVAGVLDLPAPELARGHRADFIVFESSEACPVGLLHTVAGGVIHSVQADEE